MQIEQLMRSEAPGFVAGFANAAEGDVSPNVWGPREGDKQHDLLRMRHNADQQKEAALRLWQEAAQSPPEPLALRIAHRHVDFSNVELREAFHGHAAEKVQFRTSQGCIGVSMIGGAVLDGPSWAISFAPPGSVFDAQKHLTLVPHLQREQAEKRISLPCGPVRLTPQVLPVQVLLIGSLAVVALPFETTTMAGRRVVSTALASLLGLGGPGSEASPTPIAKRGVVAGLSNAYCGYMTTREEYAAQHYEGASTHFGPNQLAACLQHVHDLCSAIASMPAGLQGVAACDPGPRPPAPPPMPRLALGVLHDNLPLLPRCQFGGVRRGYDAKKDYWAGHDTVEVRFWAGHPKNGLRPGPRGSFAEVQRLTAAGSQSTSSDEGWEIVLDDNDIDTEFEWRRIPIDCSEGIVRWRIAEATPSGTYRLALHGDYKSGWTGVLWPYRGVSSAFRVINRGERPSFSA